MKRPENKTSGRFSFDRFYIRPFLLNSAPAMKLADIKAALWSSPKIMMDQKATATPAKLQANITAIVCNTNNNASMMIAFRSVSNFIIRPANPFSVAAETCSSQVRLPCDD